MRKLLVAAIAATSLFPAAEAGAAVITGVMDSSGYVDFQLLRYLHRNGTYTVKATFDAPVDYAFFLAHTEDKYNEFGVIGQNTYYLGGNEVDYYDQDEFSNTTSFQAFGYYSRANYRYNIPTYGSYWSVYKRGRIETDASFLTLNSFDGEKIAYRIEVTGSATVPEPATWAMMILGFGAAGSVLRRRRQHLVAG